MSNAMFIEYSVQPTWKYDHHNLTKKKKKEWILKTEDHKSEYSSFWINLTPNTMFSIDAAN